MSHKSNNFEDLMKVGLFLENDIPHGRFGFCVWCLIMPFSSFCIRPLNMPFLVFGTAWGHTIFKFRSQNCRKYYKGRSKWAYLVHQELQGVLGLIGLIRSPGALLGHLLLARGP